MIYDHRMPNRANKTPRRRGHSHSVPVLAGGVPALLLLAVAAACDPALSPVNPEPVQNARALPDDFHRGINLEPIGDYGGLLDEREIDGTLEELVALGVDHVAVIPSFFQRRLGETDFYWEPSREAVDDQTRRVVQQAHELDLAVLLKPHLWLAEKDDGAWRGDIAPTPDGWPEWSENYRRALLHYAALGEELGVAAISIGSELTGVALGHPEFWPALAEEMRKTYRGSLTYAANWDREFEAISWWGALDYAGVDAFWPLVDRIDETLTPAACVSRMTEIRGRLERVAARVGRPVLLTEIGYKSAMGAAFRPWEWHEERAADPDIQALIYRCIRDAFGAEPAPHIGGVYFWIWYTSPAWGGLRNSDFTPRGKPAEGVLAGWYGAR
ncbi:MAG: hypothetical protein GKS06_00895 [Acidobacteria bacterium]|nr:hypothetical protein [Acidobacteriota bacterium]